MYHFFYTTSSPFSQWHPCSFQGITGIRYNCAEQYMMAQKARFFDDYEIADLIMQEQHPRNQKKLGRQVKNFDRKIWDNVSESIVYLGNFYKFSQNNNLKKHLLNTKDSVLVEASPHDRIWGIGYRAEDALDNIDNWGDNKLGKILTNLRKNMEK